MSLITIAVVGKDNHPLYIRDFESDSVYASPDEFPMRATANDDDDDMDPFGFFENRTTMLNESSSLKNQVRKSKDFFDVTALRYYNQKTS